MLKFIGMILIVFSTGFIGYQKASTYKARVFELNEFKKSVEMFETEVKFVKSPLCEAFNKIGNLVSGEISNIFVGFSKQYCTSNGQNVSEIWNDVINKNIKTTPLTNDDINVIKSFGDCLGATDTEGQISNIMSVLERLSYQIKCAEELRQKNAGLYQSLGIYSGILISMLLI